MSRGSFYSGHLLKPLAGSIHQMLATTKATAGGNSMKSTLKKKPVSAETIARMPDSGKDVSRFFTNSGAMRKPIQRVNVDFTASMLEELESAAKDLNVSRQGVIKTLIRQGLTSARERELLAPGQNAPDLPWGLSRNQDPPSQTEGGAPGGSG